MKQIKYYRKLLTFREKYFSPQGFLILLSFIVGLLGGLAAVILKNIVHYTHELVTKSIVVDRVSFLYFALPLVGIFLTVLFVRYFVRDKISHGVTRILYAISRRKGDLRPHNTYSSMIASTLTVSLGGSVGLEAPIVMTGSAFGSNTAKIFKLNFKAKTLLIGCGAAGAIAGIFNAPVAAIIFAIEVLMLDLTLSSIMPLMISAVTGTVVSYFLMGKEVVFSFSVQDPLVLQNLPVYILLGVICGLVSVYVNRGVKYFEGIAGKINNQYKKMIFGGIVLGILIFIFPPLFGEGYASLKLLITGNAVELAGGSIFYGIKDNYWLFLIYLLLILLLKVVAVSATTGSGGIGGIFAPALFMGGITGFITSRVINGIDLINVSERNFTLSGMAGVMAGVMHAPLTAIFLIAELTGGYSLFIPLIITAAGAFLTTIYFEPHSIYTDRLARRGDLITHHKDKAVLTLLKMESVIEKDFTLVKPDETLADLVKVISRSKRNIFPVVDNEKNFHGIILLDNIRSIIFNQELYHSTYVYDLMIDPPAIITMSERMDNVMNKFEESGAWNLPVIDEGKYVGFISKAKIFNMYRKLLVQFSDE